MRRIKLNDHVTFPTVLDMNGFLHDVGSEDEPEPADEEPPSREAQLEAALKNGPYVYELYSILIHRGR
jgi:hypothetical protein